MSKWTVMGMTKNALGEAQQSGGVGGELQQTPDFRNNAVNGEEQEAALEKWVSTLDDLLVQGASPEEAVAELAHRGCPDPEQVLELYMHMQESAGEPEGGTDLTQMPEEQVMPAPPPEVAEAAQQQHQMASYKGIPGRIEARFSDIWQEKVRFATEYGTYTVPADSIEYQDATPPAASDPISEIEEFMRVIDPAGTTLNSIEARIANLRTASNACRTVLRQKGIPLISQLRLDEMSLDLQIEMGDLKKLADAFLTPADQSYLDNQPTYEFNAVEQASLGGGDSSWLNDTYDTMMEESANTDYDQIVNEQPELIVSELPSGVLSDAAAVHQIASNYIKGRTASVAPETRDAINKSFIERTEMARRERLQGMTTSMKKRASRKVEGTDEGLFL